MWKPAPERSGWAVTSPGREQPRGLDEDVGQPRGRQQPDLAAPGTVAVLRDLSRHGVEGFAASHARQRGHHALAPGGHRGLVGALGHGDENLRQVGLGGGVDAGALLVQDLVDLFVADLDAAVDLALAHALDHDLVAQGGAKACVVHALGGQALAQYLHADLVLRRDVLHGAVDLGFLHAQPALARVGDDHALVDQRVEHLAPQLGFGRQAGATAPGFGHGPLDAPLHFTRGDEFLVDDGGDVVAAARVEALLRRGRRVQHGGQGQHGQRQCQCTRLAAEPAWEGFGHRERAAGH